MVRLREEDGVSLATLIVVLGVIGVLLATVAQLSGHNVVQSGQNRELTKAFHAAEAGAQRTAAELAYDGCFNGYPSPQEVTPPGQPLIGSFTTSITRAPGCPGPAAPKVQTVVSSGVSAVDAKDRKRVQLVVKLRPRLGFNEAIFADTGLSWGGRGTITGNVFANSTPVALSPSGTIVNGDVVSRSTMSTLNSVTIDGDVFATDAVSLSSGTKVVGDVTSATAGIANNGSIVGTARYATAYTGSGSAGAQVMGASTPPSGRTLATHNGTCPAGGTSYSAASLTSYWNTNRTSFPPLGVTGIFCVDSGSGVVQSPTAKTTLRGDVTIITNASNRIELRGSIGSSATRRLVLISNSASASAGTEALRVVPAPGSPMTIGTTVSTLLYAPGTVRIDYKGDLVGVVYGRVVSIPGGLHSLRYTPAFTYPNEPEGFDFHVGSGPRFDVQFTEFREISAR